MITRNTPWTPEIDALILTPIAHPYTTDALARDLNDHFDVDVTGSAVRARRGVLRRLIADEATAATISALTSPPASPNDADELLRSQGMDPAQWRLTKARRSVWGIQKKGGAEGELNATRIEAELRAGDADTDVDEAWLMNLIALRNRPAPEKPAPVALSGSGETQVVDLSDLHLGKLADAAMTGPTFIYNTTIALERAHLWLAKAVASIKRHRPKRVVLLGLGDNLEGDKMRPGHAARTDMSDGRQARVLTDFLVEVVATIADACDELGIPLDAIFLPGNHPRIGLKGEGLTEDNLETIIAHALTHVFASRPNVRIQAVTTPEILLSYNGKTILATHGDRISNPSEAAHLAYLRLMEDAYGCHIDIMVSAHWHVFSEYHQQNRSMICNGGFDSGACDFARNQIHKNTRPEQVTFGLDDGDGIAWREVIAVGPTRSVAIPFGDVEEAA